jgi:hypothetical protein
MAGSIRPVHMIRTVLISGVYCSLETPAKSAAEYPHHVQQKARILGTNWANVTPLYNVRIRGFIYHQSKRHQSGLGAADPYRS